MSWGWSTKKSCSFTVLLPVCTFKARLMDFSTSIFWGKLQCIVSFCFYISTLAFVPSKASNWFPTDLLLFVVLCHVYINSNSSTRMYACFFPWRKVIRDPFSISFSVWEKSGDVCSNNSSKYRTFSVPLPKNSKFLICQNWSFFK